MSNQVVSNQVVSNEMGGEKFVLLTQLTFFGSYSGLIGFG